MFGRRNLALLSVLVAAVLLLGGCTKAQSDQRASPGGATGRDCQTAAAAVADVRRVAGRAVDQLVDGPLDARDRLSGLRDGVQRAQKRTGGRASRTLGSVSRSLGSLISQAEAVAGGAAVDRTAVVRAQERLSRAVNTAENLC